MVSNLSMFGDLNKLFFCFLKWNFFYELFFDNFEFDSSLSCSAIGSGTDISSSSLKYMYVFTGATGVDSPCIVCRLGIYQV